MLKIRLQGTTKDIKWFLKMMERDKRFVINNPSRFLPVKGTEKYKRVFTEVFRDEEDLRRYAEQQEIERQSKYYGSGTVFIGRSRRNSDY
jgi:hypothetical protein